MAGNRRTRCGRAKVCGGAGPRPHRRDVSLYRATWHRQEHLCAHSGTIPALPVDGRRPRAVQRVPFVRAGKGWQPSRYRHRVEAGRSGHDSAGILHRRLRSPDARGSVLEAPAPASDGESQGGDYFGCRPPRRRGCQLLTQDAGGTPGQRGDCAGRHGAGTATPDDPLAVSNRTVSPTRERVDFFNSETRNGFPKR